MGVTKKPAGGTVGAWRGRAVLDLIGGMDGGHLADDACPSFDWKKDGRGSGRPLLVLIVRVLFSGFYDR